MRWSITILAVALACWGWAGPGWAAAWPCSAVVVADTTLVPIAGSAVRLKRFECLWVAKTASHRVEVLVPGRGLRVGVRLVKSLRLPGWGELALVQPRRAEMGGPWWLERARVRSGTVELKAVGWVERAKVRVVPGPVSIHRWRLRRLARARLPKRIVERLMAGKVEVGDSMWLVEMALGQPQRSFMVNYFRDEQHYVYLRPGGLSILVRFKGGKLVGPLPPQLSGGR